MIQDAPDPAAAARLAGPFPVDPAVLAAIRPMEARDAPQVARLHHASMGRSLWARLGLPFLETLYEVLLDSPRFLAFVYEEGARVRGFIAGSTDTPAMYREVGRAHTPRLAMQAARRVWRDPGALVLLHQTSRYFEASGSDIPAESLFCSFEPDLRGTRVSGHINKVLFDDLRSRGHRYVKVTTEVDNPGSNRQLAHWGFVVDRRFTFYGKTMVRYVLDLEASPRVEPVGRHPAV
ncbi:MAG: hypothetical protein JXB39_09910 [Deltaproteobacteria bacterium]|nr:hypothetical protein [Deltaproteobacteria bacterium]